ncbi:MULTISPECIES: hypothetical protein [Microbacterium]|uniref:hypothetical protein n=1 Tax=Microbacterium TaxID=33882 RepID=UPI0003DE1672|nr:MULTISPECIES: hypothetical protein [Microbacterium]CDJ99085.1 hypothetical protein MIC448_1150006 [Microbacterium sp. C448]
MSDDRVADADAVEIPADVAELLHQLYLPRGSRGWLLGHNAHLEGRRPIDCIKMGDVASVIEALNVEIQGGMA